MWNAFAVMPCMFCLYLGRTVSFAPLEASVLVLLVCAHRCLFVLPWRRWSQGVAGPLDPLRICWLACECRVSLSFGWQQRLLHLLVLFLDLWCSCALKTLCLTLLLLLYLYATGFSIANALGTSRAQILCCSVVQFFFVVMFDHVSWLPCQWGQMVAHNSYAVHIGKQKLEFLGWHLFVLVVAAVSLLVGWACTIGTLES